MFAMRYKSDYMIHQRCIYIYIYIMYILYKYVYYIYIYVYIIFTLPINGKSIMLRYFCNIRFKWHYTIWFGVTSFDATLPLAILDLLAVLVTPAATPVSSKTFSGVSKSQ